MREMLRHWPNKPTVKVNIDSRLQIPPTIHLCSLFNNLYIMADIANRAKEVAKEDAERIKVLAQDAFESRAYLYPIKV